MNKSNNKIMVSICCITYNHEKYIKDALDGFLMQKVNFNFEILIHDDASTDNTVKIIKEYEKKYPNVIKPIYQKENQYKKGKRANVINWTRAIGKYIALCEGDDFWTCPTKLQEQVDYMENNKNCTLCFHAANYVNEDKSLIGEMRPYNENRICNISDFIKKSDSYPTASLLFPKSLLDNLPEYYHKSPVGDLPLELYCVSSGYGYYINKIMAGYRYNIPGSWTARVANNSTAMLEHDKKIIKVYELFNKETNYQYNDLLDEYIKEKTMHTELNSGNYRIIKEKEYKKYLKKYPFINRVKIYIKCYLPFLNTIHNKIKYKGENNGRK